MTQLEKKIKEVRDLSDYDSIILLHYLLGVYSSDENTTDKFFKHLNDGLDYIRAKNDWRRK